MLRALVATPDTAAPRCRGTLAAFPAASLAALALAGCSPGPDSAPANSPTPEAEIAGRGGTAPPAGSLSARLDAIGSAVGRWRAAGDLAAARRNAEEARNLIVGPAGPFYGDADGDGTVAGASLIGLLPGTRGEPGLASRSSNACVNRDVLGGDWRDPARRWGTLETAITEWNPGNNTFPALPSHPQRIVGWATLALAADSAAAARAYAGHAQIHADVTRTAVMQCGTRGAVAAGVQLFK